MAPFIDILSGVWKGVRCDDDFYDRLSHRYTALIMVVFVVLISSKQYVGDPIICWTPAEFTGVYSSYANQVCWISNTYYLPFEERIPGANLPRAHIPYYQWVPIVMLLQALLFYLPTIAWRLSSCSTGIDVNTMVNCVTNLALLDPDKRRDTIKYLVRHMDGYFGCRKTYDKECCGGGLRGCITKVLICCKVGKRYGNHLTFLYLSVKVLFLANAIGQLFLLNAFLGTAYHLYGFDVLNDLVLNRDWWFSGRFPRVTLCDFKVRQLGGNIHRHTVQCVLPINLFNEKIYMFIWFWLVFVSAATVYGFVPWINLFFKGERRHFVRKNLRLMGRLGHGENGGVMCKNFIHQYLRQDGTFVLKLLGRNSNDMIVAEFTAELYDYFRKTYTKQDFEDAEEEPLQMETV
ncbi:innexin unc-9 [Lingula anatina]|uniref:Innexin n=1 Tax=Lingula anatina TaxID=7574 RepID=A0A1S3K2D3_LINAN|nr:innexin unc-9 [Lingula anatina]|eukprot:XP_013416795.1 innexin unc-9 [Lingula anatina]